MTRAPGKKEMFLSGALLFAASLARTGYSVMMDNQPIHAPVWQRWMDPTLYPGDAFVSTLGGYASFVWPVFGLIARFVPAETLLWVLFLCERALVIAGAGYLAAAVIPGSRTAVIAAMAFFAGFARPILGEGTLVLPYFEQTGLAVALFLWAAGCYFRGHRYRTALLTGLLFSINGLYAIFSVSYFLAVFLADRALRADWKRWAGPAALAVLTAAPAVAAASGTAGSGTADNALWMSTLKFYYPDHFFPEVWRHSSLIKSAAAASAAAVIFTAARGKHQRLFVWNASWLFTALLWLAGSYTAAYAFRSPSLLLLHPVRALDLWVAFAGVSLAAFLASSVDGLRAARSIVLLTCAAGVLVFALRWNEDGSWQAAAVSRPAPAIGAIADWARRHTEKTDKFLVDPTWDSFRPEARRGVFLAWNDGSAMLWHKPFAAEYINRLRMIGVRPEEMPEAPGSAAVRARIHEVYDKAGDALSARIAEYDPAIRYRVVRDDQASGYPEVYRHSGYKVLSVNTRQGGGM